MLQMEGIWIRNSNRLSPSRAINSVAMSGTYPSTVRPISSLLKTSSLLVHGDIMTFVQNEIWV